MATSPLPPFPLPKHKPRLLAPVRIWLWGDDTDELHKGATCVLAKKMTNCQEKLNLVVFLHTRRSRWGQYVGKFIFVCGPPSAMDPGSWKKREGSTWEIWESAYEPPPTEKGWVAIAAYDHDCGIVSIQLGYQRAIAKQMDLPQMDICPVTSDLQCFRTSRTIEEYRKWIPICTRWMDVFPYYYKHCIPSFTP